MSSWYWWAALLVITFVSRWWPRLVFPDAHDNDSYYHLAQAENIRAHRFRWSRRHPQFVIAGEYNYPPVYHYLLALFPRKMREEFAKISSALFDTLLVALFLWLAVQELQPLGWDRSSLFLLGLSFALSPALVGLGTGPRAYQATPRTLGELMIAVIFVCLWRYGLDGSWLWMIIAVLVGSLVLNTSKFSGQVLLFFSWLMAFLLNSVTLLVFPLFCVVGAIVVSKGHYWRILLAQMKHLRLYATNIVTQHPTTRSRLRWSWPKDLRELVGFWLFRNVYGIILVKFSFPLLIAGLVAWNAIFNKAYGADPFLVAWLASAFLTFLVISTPSFVFLGEADRYLEYALIPAFLLFSALSEPSYRYPLLVGFGGLHLVLYVMYSSLFLWRYGRERRYSTSLLALMTNLRGQQLTVVLSLLGFAPWELVYRTDHQVCYSESLGQLTKGEYERFFWRYPWPRPDFRYYVEKYGVGLIAVSKRTVERAQKEGCNYKFDGLDKVFENEEHVLYSVPGEYTARYVT